MRIGIDIDDVLTDTSKVVGKYLGKKRKNYIKQIMLGNIPAPLKVMIEKCAYELFQDIELKKGAKEIIDKWLNEGHQVFFVTSRSDEKITGLEKLTLDFLKNNKIGYSGIIFNSVEKGKDCFNNGIEILVDDSIENCENVELEGVMPILFNSEINATFATPIQRVNDWKELNSIIQEYNLEKTRFTR